MYIIKVTKFGDPPRKVKINIDQIKNYFKVNHSKKRTKKMLEQKLRD